MTYNFCELPFTEIFLYPNGDIKPCCSMRGSFGNLNSNQIQDIIYSDKAKEVRQYMLDGKWHPNCKTCQRQEQQGVRSERIGNYQQLLNATKSIKNDTFLLRRLDLRWSNTCNLSCVYCYEGFSSKWASIKGISINDINQENEESLFHLIEKNKDTITNIMLLGGEPLLQKQNSRLIELLNDKNFYLISNLTVPLRTNKIAQQLIECRNTIFGVSFETVGDRFEYVRRGGSWNTFTQNINYLNDLDKPLEAHSLYSIYSAFNLIEFYDYATENNFRNIFWNLLESAGENSNASIYNLPKALKESAVKELDNCIKKYFNAPGIVELKTFRQNLINSFNNSKTTSEYHFKEIESVESLQPYNKKFSDLWPKIYKRMSKC